MARVTSTVDLDGITLAALMVAATAPRSSASNGRKPMLTADRAVAVAETIAKLRDPEARALREGLRAQRGDDAVMRRALILTAVFPRREALLGKDAGAAAAELSTFAADLQTVPSAELMTTTSLIDLDETTDDSPFDPRALDLTPAQRGRFPRLPKADDGMFQRYGEGCGPAALAVLRGQIDPAFALAVRGGADPELPILAEHNADQRLRLQVKLLSVVRELDAPSEEAREALLDHLLLKTPAADNYNATLAAVRNETGGFPSPAEEVALHDAQPVTSGRRGAGILGVRLLEHLNAEIGTRLGVEYTMHSLYREGDDATARERSPEFVEKRVASLITSLAAGTPVVIGTSEPDHYWSIVAARGDQVLIHDTKSGATLWAPTRELVDGTFAARFIGPGLQTFVDFFFLPA